MRRYQAFLLLGLAMCMALATSVLIYKWLQRQPPVVEKIIDPQTETVIVAASNLFWGTKLTQGVIKPVSFPKNSLPDGHFSTPESLEGRVLIANVMTYEPILESKLAPRDVTMGGVAAVTNPEKRAMAVKVDDVVGVAGFINPGNRVDVLVTIKQSPPETKTVLQNVLVLATGSEVERKGKEEKPSPVKVITLEVTPEEGEKLALAATEGKILLALRNQLNAEPVLTKGATIPALLDSYRIHNAPKPATKGKKVVEVPPVQVEVIKGGKVSTFTFEGPSTRREGRD
jgi:pilus assembly protein CpaB